MKQKLDSCVAAIVKGFHVYTDVLLGAILLAFACYMFYFAGTIKIMKDPVSAVDTARFFPRLVFGAMIPLLALGIPGDGPTAMLLGAFTIHGLVAGPLLFRTSGDLVNLIFAAMLVCSVIMIVVEFYGIRIFSKIIDVPREILYPVVLAVCVVASFAENRQMFDVWLLLVFGILGFIMSKFGLPRACFVMGLVLGANVETNLRRALQLSQGSFAPFFTRPVSCVLLIITFAIVVRTIWTQVKSAKAAKEG